MDAVGIARGDRRHVVGGVRSEAPRAQRQPVGPRRNRIEHPSDPLRVRHDARQAEDVARRVVGMDAEPHSKLLRRRHDFLEEPAVVGADRLAPDAVVALQRLAQPRDVVAVEGARQPRHDRMEQRLAVAFRRLLEPRGGLRAHFRGIVVLRRLAAQHVDLEGRHPMRLEPQAGAAPRDRRGEVGARPVEKRHEVVADREDPFGRKVRHGLAVIGEERGEVPLPPLDALVDRQALDHDPVEARRLDLGLARGDGLPRPDLAIGDLVERRHDARRPSLGDLGQGDLVERPVPAPALDHASPTNSAIAPRAPLATRRP